MATQVASLVSQHTPAAPQMPLAHSAVIAQVAPGPFLGWQTKAPSQ